MGHVSVSQQKPFTLLSLNMVSKNQILTAIYRIIMCGLLTQPIVTAMIVPCKTDITGKNLSVYYIPAVCKIFSDI